MGFPDSSVGKESTYNAAAAKSLQLCPTLCDPMDGSPPGSLGFSRQEHWSGLPFPSPNLQCRRPQFDSWLRKIHWRRDRLPSPVFLGFSCGSAGKESVCNVGDLHSIAGLGRSPGGGHGNPHQYHCLENSMDCIVLGVAKSWTRLSDFHFISHQSFRNLSYTANILKYPHITGTHHSKYTRTKSTLI